MCSSFRIPIGFHMKKLFSTQQIIIIEQHNNISQIQKQQVKKLRNNN